MVAEDEADWSRAVAEAQPAFARFMGVRITSASRDQVEAELTVSDELINRNGVMHGGAIMAFADILGGAASVLNRPEGARTTTIESKTNLFRSVSLGETARAVCIPLHRGGPQWCGRPRSRAAMAGVRRSSRRRSSSCALEGRKELSKGLDRNHHLCLREVWRLTLPTCLSRSCLTAWATASRRAGLALCVPVPSLGGRCPVEHPVDSSPRWP